MVPAAKAGDEVDVAGYVYTLWNKAPKRGTWWATRDDSHGNVLVARIKQRKTNRGTSWVIDLAPVVKTPAVAIARKSDPVTSKAAAVRVSPRTGTQKYRLLIEYERAGRTGLTDYEAAASASMLNVGYWKRCSDLRNDEFIAPLQHESGNLVTRYSPNGDAQMVCAITDSGLAALPPKLEHHVQEPQYVHSVCVTCGGADAVHFPDCESLAEPSLDALVYDSFGLHEFADAVRRQPRW